MEFTWTIGGRRSWTFGRTGIKSLAFWSLGYEIEMGNYVVYDDAITFTSGKLCRMKRTKALTSSLQKSFCFDMQPLLADEKYIIKGLRNILNLAFAWNAS